MAITAADVMKLRKMTSAGMMDCKKALEEAEGDFNKAIGIIREKGKLVAAKRADRETSEGAVKARIEGNKAILICLGCETDFVSRNSDFQNLAEAIADVAIANAPADIVEAPFVASYIHTLNGKIGAIVGFNKEIPADLAKGVVMQVASMNPVAISAADCSKEVVDNELAVAVQKTREEMVLKAVEAALKKAGINPAHVDSEEHIESNTAKGWITPEQAEQAREIIRTVSAEKAANLNEQMIQNIANGRLQKFFKEQTLEEQEYQMSDDHISVKAAIQAADKDAKVVAFKRFSLAD